RKRDEGVVRQLERREGSEPDDDRSPESEQEPEPRPRVGPGPPERPRERPRQRECPRKEPEQGQAEEAKQSQRGFVVGRQARERVEMIVDHDVTQKTWAPR